MREDTGGQLIAFEGMDGCGKTTQAKLLARHLEAQGHPVMTVKEPGGTNLGRRIRDLLLDSAGLDIRPLAELFLYEASRAQLVETRLQPALKQGKVVIADRFFISSLAYQGYGRGLPIDQVNTVNRIATARLVPDLTVLLDVPFSVLLERKPQGERDRIERENENFYCRVRKGFKQSLSNVGPSLILDGTKDKEELHRRVLEKAEKIIQ